MVICHGDKSVSTFYLWLLLATRYSWLMYVSNEIRCPRLTQQHNTAQSLVFLLVFYSNLKDFLHLNNEDEQIGTMKASWFSFTTFVISLASFVADGISSINLNLILFIPSFFSPVQLCYKHSKARSRDASSGVIQEQIKWWYGIWRRQAGERQLLRHKDRKKKKDKGRYRESQRWMDLLL